MDKKPCKFAVDNGGGWECSCYRKTFCWEQEFDRNPDGTVNCVLCNYDPMRKDAIVAMHKNEHSALCIKSYKSWGKGQIYYFCPVLNGVQVSKVPGVDWEHVPWNLVEWMDEETFREIFKAQEDY